MSESDEIAARLTVLEIVVRQLITHMAVRTDDPARWVETRKTLARLAIHAEAPWQADRLIRAAEALFDQAEAVACDYVAVRRTRNAWGADALRGGGNKGIIHVAYAFGYRSHPDGGTGDGTESSAGVAFQPGRAGRAA